LLFSYWHFFRSLIVGAVHSAIIYIFIFFSRADGVIGDDGKVADLWIFSITLYTSIIFVVDFKLALYTKFWTILFFITLIGLSLLLFIAYMWASDDLFPSFLLHKTAS